MCACPCLHAELFYQAGRDEDEEDDAPIIKHSPLVEEQLAGVLYACVCVCVGTRACVPVCCVCKCA